VAYHLIYVGEEQLCFDLLETSPRLFLFDKML
jgi:hypothetical protein